MNITVTKVIRELKIKHSYKNMDNDNIYTCLLKEVIKDTIDVINDELIKHKNISIKK